MENSRTASFRPGSLLFAASASDRWHFASRVVSSLGGSAQCVGAWWASSTLRALPRKQIRGGGRPFLATDTDSWRWQAVSCHGHRFVFVAGAGPGGGAPWLQIRRGGRPFLATDTDSWRWQPGPCHGNRFVAVADDLPPRAGIWGADGMGTTQTSENGCGSGTRRAACRMFATAGLSRTRLPPSAALHGTHPHKVQKSPSLPPRPSSRGDFPDPSVRSQAKT